MIYVNVEAVKSEGRGLAGGNGWHDTDDVAEAIRSELERFGRMWSHLGHGAAVTYQITVATEASPRRTSGGAGREGRPLPVGEGRGK